MSLKATLEEIKKVKGHAEENLDNAPPETLNARRGRKANAIESLKRLKRDYKRDMLDSAVFLVAVGSGREDFANIVSTENKWFSANPEVFYTDLANRVPTTLYLGKTGISDIFEVIGRHLEDKMNELDLIEYNQLIFKAQYAQKINSKEELATLLKRAINNQIGSEIVAIQAVDSLVGEAIERSHGDAITPIVLSTGDEELALELVRDFKTSGQPVQLVGIGEVSDKLKLDGIMLLEDTSKKSIKSVLGSMKKLVRK
jgi:hypothetical protein